MHKPCGMFAQLILVPAQDEDDAPQGEVVAFVKGTPEFDKPERKVNLASVRGRKYG